MYYMIFFVCFQPLWTKIFSILKWNCFIHSDAGKMIEKAFSSLTALMETISFKFQHCNNSMGQQHGQLWGQGLKYILPYFHTHWCNCSCWYRSNQSVAECLRCLYSKCWAEAGCRWGILLGYWENIVMAVLWWTQWEGCHH